MSDIKFTVDRRFLAGSEHWSSPLAVDEMEIYCDLLENLEHRIDSLEIQGKLDEVTLLRAHAVISSYALEIAMKSLWALDHPDKTVYHTHNLLKFFDELKAETQESIVRLQLTREVLEESPKPFYDNRYSMEYDDKRDDREDKGRKKRREYVVYWASELRSLVQLIGDNLEESRESRLRPPQA